MFGDAVALLRSVGYTHVMRYAGRAGGGWAAGATGGSEGRMADLAAGPRAVARVMFGPLT